MRSRIRRRDKLGVPPNLSQRRGRTRDREGGPGPLARPAPPLVAHVPVSVHDNQGEVRDAVRQQLGFFPKAPFYQRMFTVAGFPETDKGEWSDRMIDAVAISGEEDQVTHGLKELATFAGEIMVSLVAAGADKEASRERTSRLLSEIAPELARA